METLAAYSWGMTVHTLSPIASYPQPESLLPSAYEALTLSLRGSYPEGVKRLGWGYEPTPHRMATIHPQRIRNASAEMIHAKRKTFNPQLPRRYSTTRTNMVRPHYANGAFCFRYGVNIRVTKSLDGAS